MSDISYQDTSLYTLRLSFLAYSFIAILTISESDTPLLIANSWIVFIMSLGYQWVRFSINLFVFIH